MKALYPTAAIKRVVKPDAVTWTPFVGPQTLAYHSPADELFYGGAAGGGKTALLVGLSLTAHRKSLILRRVTTHLGEVTTQLIEQAGDAGRWRSLGAYGGTMTTSDGRIIECKGCKDEGDKEDYKGRPHDLKAFDELADFTESQYVFIGGWNRSTYPGQRCRIVSAGNPPTRGGGDWVIRRWSPWVDPTHGRRAMPGELRYYSTIDGKETELADATPFKWKSYTITPTSRTFIPATLADNPILNATNYASKLAAMPDALRRAYLDGDFGVSLQDDAWQVIPSRWIKAAMDRWTANGGGGVPIDRAGFDIAYGGSDSTCLVTRHGQWLSWPRTWKGEDTNSGKKAAQLCIDSLGTNRPPINCDVIGYGAAAYEFLKEQKYQAESVNFGAGANGQRDRRGVLEFANIRALAYWQLRDMMDPDLGGCLAIPPDPELFAELAAPRYESRGGRIVLKSKEEICLDLGRSPDRADAVALACYEPAKAKFFFESF